jgi:hypothetical protein
MVLKDFFFLSKRVADMVLKYDVQSNLIIMKFWSTPAYCIFFCLKFHSKQTQQNINLRK